MSDNSALPAAVTASKGHVIGAFPPCPQWCQEHDDSESGRQHRALLREIPSLATFLSNNASIRITLSMWDFIEGTDIVRYPTRLELMNFENGESLGELTQFDDPTDATEFAKAILRGVDMMKFE